MTAAFQQSSTHCCVARVSCLTCRPRLPPGPHGRASAAPSPLLGPRAQEVTEHVGFQPGVPVKPMLAKPTTGVSEARGPRPPAWPAGEAPNHAHSPSFCHVHGGCKKRCAAVSSGSRRSRGGWMRCRSQGVRMTARAAGQASAAYACAADKTMSARAPSRALFDYPQAPMRAGAAAAQVLDKFAGTEFTVEYKYDGERAQVHVLEDGRVAIYRRAAARAACRPYTHHRAVFILTSSIRVRQMQAGCYCRVPLSCTRPACGRSGRPPAWPPCGPAPCGCRAAASAGAHMGGRRRTLERQGGLRACAVA